MGCNQYYLFFHKVQGLGENLFLFFDNLKHVYNEILPFPPPGHFPIPSFLCK